jgi:hypothetical protein
MHNEPILGRFQRICSDTEKRGTWRLNGGFDRRELLAPLLKSQMAFVVRQRGGQHIGTTDAQRMPVENGPPSSTDNSIPSFGCAKDGPSPKRYSSPKPQRTGCCWCCFGETPAAARGCCWSALNRGGLAGSCGLIAVAGA